jgi:Ecdysteroid kinase-like family
MLTIPRTPSELGVELLRACLVEASAPGADALASIRIQPFAEGVGLLGKLVRVELQYRDAAPHAPRSVVVKLASAYPQNVALCEALRLYQREHDFYTHAQALTPLRTPRLYGSRLEGLGRPLLVLEDVPGPWGNQLAGASHDQAERAVVAIAAHHARFWDHGRSGALAWLPSIAEPAIVGVVQALVAQSVQGLVRALPEAFSEYDRALAALLAERVPALSAALCARNRTFVHGDFRVDNMAFGSELLLADWQVCYEACAPYDLAYLATQSLSVAQRQSSERALLARYHDALLEHDVRGYSLAACFDDYRRAATYCVVYPLLAAGALDLSNERGRALARAMLERALSAARDADGLALLRGLA